jgi:hypothetical protein
MSSLKLLTLVFRSTLVGEVTLAEGRCGASGSVCDNLATFRGFSVGPSSASDEDDEDEEEMMKVHKPSMRLSSLISLVGRPAKFADGSHSVGRS